MRQRLLTPFSLLLLVGCQSATPAQSDDQIQRIQSAATEIALVQKSQGNDGALAAISACYEKAVTGTATSAEVCATQDYVISKVSIGFLSQLGDVGKNDRSYKIAVGAPERIAKLLSSKGLDGEQQSRFVKLVQLHALPAFEKARF